MDLVIVGVSTLVAILAVAYSLVMARLDEIRENWIQYRCNPVYMPFAGLVGDDVAANFTRCSMKSFQDYLGFIMDPINQLFGTFLNSFKSIADTLNRLREMFNSVRKGFLAIVTMIFGKLSNTLSSMQYLMLRIRTVYMRIIGAMTILMRLLQTGTGTVKSVIDGPVGKTVKFFSGG